MPTVFYSEHTCRLHVATIFQVSILKLKGQLLEINTKWAHIEKHHKNTVRIQTYSSLSEQLLDPLPFMNFSNF